MTRRPSGAYTPRAASRPLWLAIGLVLVLVLALQVGPLAAQVAESKSDPFAIALPYPHRHLAHTTDPALEGGTAHLRSARPMLLYQLGRDLLQRQFTRDQGAYGRAGRLDVPLYVGLPAGDPRLPPVARFARDHASACGFCHSSTYREPAAGQTIASTGGEGRNTPHFYGAGLVEMLGAHVLDELFARCDGDGNRLFDRREVATRCRALVEPLAGDADGGRVPAIDYGHIGVDAHGVPRLDSVFRVWYVDSDGQVIPGALGLDDPRVAAYGVSFQPFGWGRGRLRLSERTLSQGGEGATIREVVAIAADVHMGLQAHDPTQHGSSPAARTLGGVAGVSLAGARQYDTGGAVDLGWRKTASGLSLDDPDGDGRANELTAGDLDAIEHFLLHAPAPAYLPAPGADAGRRTMREIGCTRCHVESWRLPAADPATGRSGDRRLFRFVVEARGRPPRLEGRLESLARRRADGVLEPRAGALAVDGIYSDFRHRDLGPAFHERRFDGSLQRRHRTAPLWGVGSTAPYGHHGGFGSLDEVIAAHGGEASTEAEAYRRLGPRERVDLIAFLRSLVLYPTDEIPADIDGDGTIAESYRVGDQSVGRERFDARFLFLPRPSFRPAGTVPDADGSLRALWWIDAVEEVYGLDLPGRIDLDRDGFPDVIDPVPFTVGLERAP